MLARPTQRHGSTGVPLLLFGGLVYLRNSGKFGNNVSMKYETTKTAAIAMKIDFAVVVDMVLAVCLFFF